MRSPARILIVDDNAVNLDILRARLAAHGYETLTAQDGEAALAAAREHAPDLILLDIMMPKLDGLEVCRRLKADESFPFTPVIMTTAKANSGDVVAGLEAGAEEYLTKPIDQVALVARVRSMLRVKELHDTVQAQAAALADWSRTLEARVDRQVAELERVGRLRRFLAPQVADAIVSGGSEAMLDSHRREVTVVFCDLRGFTPFAETAEPEELLGVLRAYHAALGELVHRAAGTLERFAGDGLMVFFNDPLPQPDHAARAVRMAAAMRERVAELAAGWRRRGHELGFGVGVATGYANLGRIGFEGRSDYACVGPVTNLAARLCAAAAPGQILVSQRVLAAAESAVALEVERVPDPELRGLLRPASVYNLLRAQDGAEPAAARSVTGPPDAPPAGGHETRTP